MRPLPVSGGSQRESGTFFFYIRICFGVLNQKFPFPSL
nr:MAG TPA: NADH dehydrogenase subunit 2 C-terminus [Caudoviricetes sp.]DAX38769.1 MAG TPA: NADH dehydrogenase subunit 2 C-terminus [Caudoviricetes sp.]